jgi:hypothetical protein
MPLMNRLKPESRILDGKGGSSAAASLAGFAPYCDRAPGRVVEVSEAYKSAISRICSAVSPTAT